MKHNLIYLVTIALVWLGGNEWRPQIGLRAQSPIESFPEIKAGWAKLEAQNEQVVAQYKTVKNRPGGTKTHSVQTIKKLGNWTLVHDLNDDLLLVAGPEHVFKIKREDSNTENWYLIGEPMPLAAQGLGAVAAELDSRVMPQEPANRAARNVLGSWGLGLTAPYRYYVPEGDLDSTTLDEFVSADGRRLKKLAYRVKGIPNGESAPVDVEYEMFLDPENDYRVVSGARWTSTGKTRAELAIDYRDENGRDFVFTWRTLKNDGSGLQLEVETICEVAISSETVDPAEFRLPFYNIHLSEPKSPSRWPWVLAMGGALILLGVHLAYRQQAA